MTDFVIDGKGRLPLALDSKDRLPIALDDRGRRRQRPLDDRGRPMTEAAR